MRSVSELTSLALHRNKKCSACGFRGQRDIAFNTHHLVPEEAHGYWLSSYALLRGKLVVLCGDALAWLARQVLVVGDCVDID